MTKLIETPVVASEAASAASRPDTPPSRGSMSSGVSVASTPPPETAPSSRVCMAATALPPPLAGTAPAVRPSQGLNVSKTPAPVHHEVDPDAAAPRGALQTVLTALNYALLLMWSYGRELYRMFIPDRRRVSPDKGYAKLTSGTEEFFARRIVNRVNDCLNRPINTRAGRVIGVMERKSDPGHKKFELTGRTIPCVNLASYNYLGFSEDLPSITDDNFAALERFGVGSCAASLEGGKSTILRDLEEETAQFVGKEAPAVVTDDNFAALERFGVGSCAASLEGGKSTILRDLEEETAQFVGKEAAVVYAMGFATNFSGLAPLFCKDTLVISDSLNHASLVAGVRVSDGRVKVFKHNDLGSLERTVRRSIIDGQPRTHRKWKRIVILVEGIYSMEGEILDLPRVVEIKKKYKCLLYVDEAHSIGALGANGRGVCEHHGVNPADVDLLMGTYTKAFGSIGGYIAGDRKLIEDLRRYSGASLMGETLHSAAAQQALSSLRVILGQDGTTVGREKLERIRRNAAYVRSELNKRDLVTLGEPESPVVPIMLYQPAKLALFSRLLLERNVAVVVVGYPATPLFEGRCRLCVSAAHTKDDLDRAIAAIEEVADLINARFARPWPWHMLG
eukprot:CAMPEP_0174878260 /NCGR_PEP_ID=MMETSP1114-20130205/82666_1 /TAXON_ID=312471 /ORGANISM="Neobodo designis, Strain CCAP 1951/1" /LENGTH=620 /DNA_ID=CAMNT_0016113647 /DNA_START=565 /DNA_END=2428 /DNA_ORIENTATION=-